MNKVRVAFSIFSGPSDPYCGVSGMLELPLIPIPGDLIHFVLPKNGAELPNTPFMGVLAVERRSVQPGHDPGCHLSLESVVLDNVADAAAVAGYFEKAYGLVAIA